MMVIPGQVEDNLARAEEMIGRAGETGCDVVVLPECLDVGWTHPSARDLAEPIPGSRSRRLSAAARLYGVAVVAGLTERERDRVYNAAVLIDKRGRIRLRHRKMNELVIGHTVYDVGDRLAVTRTEEGTFGVIDPTPKGGGL